MNLHVKNIKLDVGEELTVIINVPFAQSDSQLLWSILFDTMSCSQQMCSINQTSSTNVNIVILLLLQQGNLPRILSKLCITLGIFLGRIVDPSVDAMSVPPSTLSILTELGLGTGGQAVQGLAE